MTRLRIVTATVAGAALLAGTAVATPAMAAPTVRPASQAAHNKYVIEIKNFGFKGDLTVKAGATVTVKNEDSVTHTLTSNRAGKFNTGQIAPHHSKTFVAPSATGRYGFHCKIHSDMTGTLVVKKHT